MADPSVPPSDYISLAAWLLGPGVLGAAALAIGRWFVGPKTQAAETTKTTKPEVTPQSMVFSGGPTDWLALNIHILIENTVQILKALKALTAVIKAERRDRLRDAKKARR